MGLIDREKSQDRARDLAVHGLNGLDFATVGLVREGSARSSTRAHLALHFLNDHRLDDYLFDPEGRFALSGGQRLRAGQDEAVQVRRVLVSVVGRSPLSETAGLRLSETLTVELGGFFVSIPLAAGRRVQDLVRDINDGLAALAPSDELFAVDLDGHIAISTTSSLGLAVTSTVEDQGDGLATGFSTHRMEPDPEQLVLEIEEIGDYSTYSLSLVARDGEPRSIDPIFQSVEFKFRPGCFPVCQATRTQSSPKQVQPKIDYLAKDYHSFRHTMFTTLQQRLDGWTPTSETDFTVVLASLIAAASDQLSDYQDRVMNEAFLSTARRRVSLARHARLMDYHIHQGRQSSTLLAVYVPAGMDLALTKTTDGLWSGTSFEFSTEKNEKGVSFVSREPDAVPGGAATRHLHSLFNELRLFTWGGARPGLGEGAITADIALESSVEAALVAERIESGNVTHLLLQEHKSPLHGTVAGRSTTKRHLVALEPYARKDLDPVTGTHYVTIRWSQQDRLPENYCFHVEVDRDGTTVGVDDVSLFHGNLLWTHRGVVTDYSFRSPGAGLSGDRQAHFERTSRGDVLCRLLHDEILLYRDVYSGEEPHPGIGPRSTLSVEVREGSQSAIWTEVDSLVKSDADDPHFTVETDELGRSVLRFGNDENGRSLADHQEVHCRFQTLEQRQFRANELVNGNVGADSIRFSNGPFEKSWNPFDVTDGRAPETPPEIRRNVPEFFRSEQERAITLDDYVLVAESVDGVQRAAARYAWTGSWRTVQLTIDEAGHDRLSQGLAHDVARTVEPLRLIGEDIEIRAPQYVPLRIEIILCVDPEVWPRHVEQALDEEFSDGLTSDGRPGFFNPDLWTFGQALFPSEILGRLHRISGIDHVRSLVVQRQDDRRRSVRPTAPKPIHVGPMEIVQVRNDPDHAELGTISFDLRGGRQ